MSEDKEIKVAAAVIGGESGAGLAAARHLAGLGVAAHPVSLSQAQTPLQTKEEELATVDPKLQEAYAKLTEEEKIYLQRGYKTFKKRGAEYKLVENNPFEPRVTGPKFTPKKKKRKK